MNNLIKKENIMFNTDVFNNKGIMVKNLLAGEIPGVEIKYVAIGKGNRYTVVVDKKKAYFIFFIKGSGSVSAGRESYDISEMAAFLPRFRSLYTVTASAGTLEYLEISYVLMNEEMEEIQRNHSNSCIIEYANCSTYKETIKSAKTINRTILDEKTLPRFCMGSVETTGPDEVGAHSHPMLDQLFFGLPGNDCIVRADGEEVCFNEGMLMHIPLGSIHGVRVEEGCRLNYLWMDFFNSRDMSYIRNTHLTE